MKKVLIINGHQTYPGVSEGRLNRTLVEAIKEEAVGHGYEVQVTEVEKGYDLDEEQAKHLWADYIIMQMPVFWFGTPWLTKKYIDEVFTDALIKQTLLVDDGRTRKDPSKQYGTGGKMQGRKFMASLTWNAPVEAFGQADQYLLEGKDEAAVLLPLTGTYKFCGAEIEPVFSCYNVMKAPDVERDIQRLKTHLAARWA